MALEGGKKSKTGAWSTNAEVLDDLPRLGLKLQKLNGVRFQSLNQLYADAFVTSIHPDTKRVHTSFSMVGASTGRLSSSDPNLQNIPIRTSEGRRNSTAFVPEDDAVLISADYSVQIELPAGAYC